MKGWMVPLLILGVLWLISLIRLGGRLRYGEAGLAVTVIAGPARIRVLPADREKEGQTPKPKKEKKKPEQTKPRQEGKANTLERVMKLLPVAAEAAGALRRKIRIDRVAVQLIWGASDPAEAAIGYGRAHALLGMMWPLFDHNFRVKDHDFQVECDYRRSEPAIELDLALTMSIGQLLAFGVRYGLKALTVWTKSGRAT